MMIPLTRRALLGSTATLVAGLAHALPAKAQPAATRMRLGEPVPFSFERLIEEARAQAGRPYVEPSRPDPALVQRIDYDAYGRIGFDPASAIDPDGPVPVTLNHVGMFFPKTVRMHLVESGDAREIVYDPSYFSMSDDHVASGLPAQPSAFAGFWLREPESRGDWRELEPWATCLGASYWRAVGELGQVGMSARGIALSPAGTAPEEFPDFIAHWFLPETEGRDAITVFSLLDGPSIAGAYRMRFERTGGVLVDVEKHLFLRRDVERLGIAPLTSMYWYGEADKRRLEDWRPEVHDSDGLAIWNGAGEWLWRPLNNPSRVTTSSFLDERPKGFGLSQRDRNFDHYQDGVRYQDRPGCWIEPLEDWGKGTVQLVEIPTDDEIYDNIVAYWVHAEPTPAGTTLSFRYRQHWTSAEPFFPENLARVVATRVGRGGEPGKPRVQGRQKFVVELDGPVLEELWGWKVKAEPQITASRGAISLVFLEPVPTTRRWRVLFDLEVQGLEPVELRMTLRAGDRALSETWMYQHRPPV